MRQSPAGRRVLVTGAAGFLGSHLCDALLARGHTVVGLDNYLTGREENIQHLADVPRFTMARRDVRQSLKGEFEQIFHLACPASPPHYQAQPIETSRICFEGSLTVLDLAAESGSRIFHASTSEVYGDPEQHPQTENYLGNVNTTGPRACYDEGKRIAETLFFDYHRKYGIDIKVARIFNTYGPRMNPWDGRVVSNFIAQAIVGQSITVYGDGRQTRSFCYVDDLVEGCLRLMDSSPDFTGPVNLGNAEEVTILQIAEEVRDLVGSKCKIVFKPLPVDDPRRRCPDLSLARERLGWVPTINLRDGLERTVRFFESELVGHGPKALRQLRDVDHQV